MSSPLPPSTFDCDVLVIGTGASGMATAVTAASQGLKVLVVEKEPRFGGTTARSGGWLWIPGNRLATEQGIHEPAGAALAYMKHETTTHFDAAARRCLPGERAEGGRLLHPQYGRAVRHAAGVPRLPRRSAGWPARRPLDGRAPLRRPRTRPAHQGPGAAAARTHRLRNDVGLGQGDQTLHARAEVGRVLRLRHQAPDASLPRCPAPWPRHDADQRQRARRTPGQGRDGPEHPRVAVVAGAEAGRRVRRRDRRDRAARWPAHPHQCASAAWCWLAAASRTTWSGARRCSRTRPPARSTTRPRR